MDSSCGRSCVSIVRFTGIALLAVSAGCTAATDEQVSVSYSLESYAVTMHEPVIVRVDVFNGSSQPVTLRLGRDRRENFQLAIESPDGSVHERPETPVREGAFDPGNVSIAPGQRLRHGLLLSEWMSFPVPGEYKIDVRLLTPIEMSSGARAVSEPYRATIRVRSRDDSKLRAACERLVRQIESTDSVREANDAARALAYVDDPIVVSYLERALRSGRYVEHPVIDGLVKVGDEDAVRILTAVVRESPAWPPSVDTRAGSRATLAWQALHTIATATSNERLRQEILQTIP